MHEVLGVACWRNSRIKVPNHVLPFLYYFSSSVKWRLVYCSCYEIKIPNAMRFNFCSRVTWFRNQYVYFPHAESFILSCSGVSKCVSKIFAFIWPKLIEEAEATTKLPSLETIMTSASAELVPKGMDETHQRVKVGVGNLGRYPLHNFTSGPKATSSIFLCSFLSLFLEEKKTKQMLCSARAGSKREPCLWSVSGCCCSHASSPALR